ncbi:MAG: A24 family peptidase [Actinomycetota bacterium]
MDTVAAVCGLLGLLLGPLLGVIVDRAAERTTLRPEHRCPHCAHGWGWRSLLPTVDWRGRCRRCDRGKGLRYPLVDLGTAAVFAGLGWRFGLDWRLAPYLALAAVLVVLSAIDVETHLLPNVIVWPSIGAGLFTVLVLSGELGYHEGVFPALVGASVFGLFTGTTHLLHEPAMGFGDVKLSLLLGLFVGWLHPGLLTATRLVLFALFLAMLGGGLIGLVINLVRRRREEIPFGPALAAASFVVIVASPVLQRTS